MVGGIFEEEPTECAVACSMRESNWYKDSNFFWCIKNAEACAERNVERAAFVAKTAKDAAAATRAAALAALAVADAAREDENNAVFAADTANKYAINTKATAEALAKNDGSEEAKKSTDRAESSRCSRPCI